MAYVLQTDRIVLRHFVKSDLDDLCRLYADKEVRRFFLMASCHAKKLRNKLPGRCMEVTSCIPASGLCSNGSPDELLIGRGGFVRWELDGIVEVEIAYMIEKNLWRRGLGSELASALLDLGFSALPVQHLIAVIDSSNTASIKTAEKIGMSRQRSVISAGRECTIFSISATDHERSAQTRARKRF